MTPSLESIDRLHEWQPGSPDAAATNVIAAIIWGARRAWGSKILIAYLWAFYVLIHARIAVIKAVNALLEILGIAASEPILAGEFNVLLSSAQSLDTSYLGMILNSVARPLWSPNGYFFLFFGIIAGGAIAYLHAPRPASFLAQIGGNCGAYLGRFVRLILIAATLSWLISTLALILAPFISRLVPGYSRGRYELVVQFVIVGCAVVIDYARVRTVLRDSRSMLMESLRSLRFVVRNLAWVVPLEILFFSFAALLGVAIFETANVLRSQSSFEYITFVGEQFYVLALIWLRLAAWGSMMALYQGATLKRLAKASA